MITLLQVALVAASQALPSHMTLEVALLETGAILVALALPWGMLAWLLLRLKKLAAHRHQQLTELLAEVCGEHA